MSRAPVLSDREARALLRLRRILAELVSLPEDRIGPGTRLRADLDMTGLELRELRVAIMEETAIWLPLDPMAEHTVLEVGLMLAHAGGL